jgi:hypothetical protein
MRTTPTSFRQSLLSLPMTYQRSPSRVPQAYPESFQLFAGMSSAVAVRCSTRVLLLGCCVPYLNDISTTDRQKPEAPFPASTQGKPCNHQPLHFTWPDKPVGVCGVEKGVTHFTSFEGADSPPVLNAVTT